MTETQKAYIAGIIDGEGCITIRVTRPNGKMKNPFYGLACIVAATDYTLLEWLQRAIGLGTIYKRTMSQSNRRQAWNYVLNTNQALAFLEEILPFLIIKKDQAVLGIEFQGLTRTPGKQACAEVQQKRQWYAEKLKELKRPKVELT